MTGLIVLKMVMQVYMFALLLDSFNDKIVCLWKNSHATREDKNERVQLFTPSIPFKHTPT